MVYDYNMKTTGTLLPALSRLTELDTRSIIASIHPSYHERFLRKLSTSKYDAGDLILLTNGNFTTVSSLKFSAYKHRGPFTIHGQEFRDRSGEFKWPILPENKLNNYCKNPFCENRLGRNQTAFCSKTCSTWTSTFQALGGGRKVSFTPQGMRQPIKIRLNTSDITIQAIRVATNYSCEICGIHENTLWNRLSVDHNHITDEARGMLCPTCNNGSTPDIPISALPGIEHYITRGDDYWYKNLTKENYKTALDKILAKFFEVIPEYDVERTLKVLGLEITFDSLGVRNTHINENDRLF